MDGMTVEDFRNALDFATWGVPDPNKWVDELRVQAGNESMRGLM